MRKFVAMLIALFFIAGAGLALAEGMKCESNMDKQGKGQEKRVNRLAKELKLTEDQKTKVAAIFKEDEPQMKVFMDKMMADMKVMRDASDQKVKSILTPDQAKQYDQIKEKHQKKMDEKMGKRGPKGEGKGMHEEGSPPAPQGMPMGK